MRCLIAITLLALILSCKNKGDKKIPDDEPTDLVIQPVTKEYDSLKKYSYALVSANSDNQFEEGYGTCFFIRKWNKLYLISNAHIFLQFDTFKKEKIKNNNIKKLVLVFDCVHKISKKDTIIIDLNKFKNEPIFGQFERPDLYVYEIKNIPKGDTIYSLEKLLLPDYSKLVTGDDMISYGYPYNSSIPKNEAYLKINPSVLEMKLVKDPKEKIITKNGKDISKFHFTASPNIEQGRSGSPVFFKSKNTPFYNFCGVITAGNHKYKTSLIIRPEELFNLLNKKR
jgi:hypothetical protein